jgi:hypothetical protein
MYACMRDGLDGGSFYGAFFYAIVADAACVVEVVVGDVLVLMLQLQLQSEATVWGSSNDPCGDQNQGLPCITCMDDSCSSSTESHRRLLKPPPGFPQLSSL